MSVPLLATKRCRTCEQVKPLSNFYRDKSTRDGLRGECKPCTNERVNRNKAEWRQLLGDEGFKARRRATVNRSRRKRGMKREREYAAAWRRAVKRLVDAHRSEFDRYFAEELRTVEDEQVAS